MGKKRKRPKVDEAEIPMSSMIDIVFLLLIYFILTQKEIIDETLLSCNLPTPGGTPPEKPPTLFTIDVRKVPNKSIREDLNTFYVHKSGTWPLNKPEAPMDLRRMLIQRGINDPKQTIMINCGGEAYHQKLIRLLNACAEANLTELNIVNEN